MDKDTKMELTNELKARFEMLYYGQRVSMLHKPEGRYSDEIFKAPQILTGPNQSEYLSLRPLSSITEEEAIELALINKIALEDIDEETPVLRTYKNKHIVVQYWREMNTQEGMDSDIYPFSVTNTNGTFGCYDHWGCCVDPIRSIDYLRSKSFLIDAFGIPSEQWVEWGVVKLKS